MIASFLSWLKRNESDIVGMFGLAFIILICLADRALAFDEAYTIYHVKTGQSSVGYCDAGQACPYRPANAPQSQGSGGQGWALVQWLFLGLGGLLLAAGILRIFKAASAGGTKWIKS